MLFFKGTELFKILVRDGDTGRPRRIDLSIAGDHQGLFSIGQQQYDEVTGVVSVTLIKSDGTVLDREDPVSDLRQRGESSVRGELRPFF